MWKQEGRYFLFFSGNVYKSPNYAVGYATCDSPLGPCQDAPENPILKRKQDKPPVIGPGHQTLVDVGEETWLVYHAWEVSATGGQGNRRFMHIDRLVWQDGRPVVQGPTVDPQPLPH